MGYYKKLSQRWGRNFDSAVEFCSLMKDEGMIRYFVDLGYEYCEVTKESALATFEKFPHSYVIASKGIGRRPPEIVINRY